ncbi:hypothetical protein C8Q80DRAFT_795146 [Daedaleopsis nitida]|nr:hypothetical protein C8Q80DRAFT_795146 [Daedaleopsis nitida]
MYVCSHRAHRTDDFRVVDSFGRHCRLVPDVGFAHLIISLPSRTTSAIVFVSSDILMWNEPVPYSQGQSLLSGSVSIMLTSTFSGGTDASGMTVHIDPLTAIYACRFILVLQEANEDNVRMIGPETTNCRCRPIHIACLVLSKELSEPSITS